MEVQTLKENITKVITKKKRLYKIGNQNKFLIRFIIITSTINFVLIIVNLFNYFSKKSENSIDLNISKYRRSDCMNIALAARSYDQISDYFTSKNDLNNGYQIVLFHQRKIFL